MLAMLGRLFRTAGLAFSPGRIYTDRPEQMRDVLPSIYLLLTLAVSWAIERIAEMLLSMRAAGWQTTWLRVLVAPLLGVSGVSGAKEAFLTFVATVVFLVYLFFRFLPIRREKTGILPLKGVYKSLIYVNAGPLFVFLVFTMVYVSSRMPVNVPRILRPVTLLESIVALVLALGALGWFWYSNTVVISVGIGVKKRVAFGVLVLAFTISFILTLLARNRLLINRDSLNDQESQALVIVEDLVGEEFQSYDKGGEYEDHAKPFLYKGYTYRVVASKKSFTIDATPNSGCGLAFHVDESGIIFAGATANKAASDLDRIVHQGAF